MHAVNEFGETYDEMVVRYERTALKLANDLTAHLDSMTARPELAFTNAWKERARDLAYVMRGLPDLLLDHTPPPHLTTLYAMYQQWAVPYVQRARLILEAIDALDLRDTEWYARSIDEVSRLSSVIAALFEARTIYIRGHFCK
jgi:hypothetical protein